MTRQTRFPTTAVLIGVVLVLAGAVAMYAFWGMDTTGKKGSGLGESFQYDLTEVRKTDPALVRYELTQSVPVRLVEPMCIATDEQGRIYLGGRGEILLPKGTMRGIYFLDDRSCSYWWLTESVVQCLAVAEGKIYIGYKDHVSVIATDKLVEEPIGADCTSKDALTLKVPGAKTNLTSIAVSGEDVFVADSGQRVVWHYDTKGKLLGQIGKPDAREYKDAKDVAAAGEDVQFVVPSPYFDLAIDAHKRLWVANPGRHRLEAYTFDGVLTQRWGKSSVKIDGFCGCCNPVNFALLPDGRFVTAEKGLPRVKIFSPDGEFESVVVGADAFPLEYACINRGISDCQGGGMDVAVDPKGRILVLETHEKKVRVYVPKGASGATTMPAKAGG